MKLSVQKSFPVFILIYFSCTILADSASAQESTALAQAPVHRFSFDIKDEQRSVLIDSKGGLHGQIHRESPPEPLPFHEGSTTVVVLPDTEVYCSKRSSIFFDMMSWAAENRKKRNIKCLLHVGDITNNNQKYEWEHARKAFDIIEGKIPYILAAGNHDYDHTEGRLSLINEYFKVKDLKKNASFGGVYETEKLENHYQFLQINGQKWIVLSLEMGPRDDVIAWANKVLAKHKDHLAIILTHAFLYYGNERYDHRKGKQRATPYNFYGEGADGEILWKLLVRRHANVMMLVCGHLSSQYVGYRKDKGVNGNVVHQMLVDYEKLKGGRGFLRLLEFLPDGKTVQVRTYSPILNEIRSPVTKGEKPLQDPILEEFTFQLQSAIGEEKLLSTNRQQKKSSTKKIHPDRANRNELVRLNGQGQLEIDSSDGSGYGKLNANLVKGRKRVSFEVWVTPTGQTYNWNPILEFTGGKDAFYYKFRTLQKHRAELIVNGHNEDIQRSINVEVGKPMHVVVTYDQEGSNGKPLLQSFVNGKSTGKMETSIKLSELNLEEGKIGPFAGSFDEIRIYDYPLSAPEVRGNYERGPEKVQVKISNR